MKVTIRSFVLLLALLPVAAFSRPWVALFGSNDCLDCAKIKHAWTSEFTGESDPVLVFLPIEHNRNYATLSRLEDELQVTDKGASFPIFVVGNKMYTSVPSFQAAWNDLRTLAALPCPAPSAAPIAEAVETATSPLITLLIQKRKPVPEPTAEPVPATVPRLLFFEQPACAKCSRQNKELELLHEKLPDLQLARYDVTTLDGRAMLTRFHNANKVPVTDKNLAPMVCWPGGWITGRLAEASELEDALRHADGEAFWLAELTDAEREAERQRSRSFLEHVILTSVISGGLADGINPCAFATSIFLISYLLFLKKRPRDIALVGFGFCTGVFIAYFCFGLGISFLLNFLQGQTWLKPTLYSLFALLSAIFAVGSLVDAFRFKKTGKSSDMMLGLSSGTHRGIHEKIRTLADRSALLLFPASIVLGAVVSSMELACTGQVYAPLLAAMLAQGMTPHFLFLLLVYNLCFILPLAVITVLACRGVGAQALANWAKEHVFATKLLMAAIFAIIAAVMVVLLILRV
ncbi:MAG: hypothetical protein IJJ26_06990 [Victivallales bacterium]|nr:hypothetical protein [Victivallales bacterium]